MKKILAKSVLAVAVTAASASVFAGTLTATPLWFAQDIFGDANTTVNGSTMSSTETLIATPLASYAVGVVHSIANTQKVTVKYTLGGSAVFGEDLSTIAKWNASTSSAVFSFAPTLAGAVGTVYTNGNSTSGPGLYTVTVESGGAIGDNTVVFAITAAAANVDLVLKTVDLSQVKVKNLTATLGAGSTANTSGKVKLGVEFRTVTATPINSTDTDVAKDILASKPVLTLTGTATTDAQRPMIQVGAAEKKFTTTLGNAAASDYTSTQTFIDLGTLAITRAVAPTDAAPLRKENGGAFDFQGSDSIMLDLTTVTGWGSYSTVKLITNTGFVDCSAAATLSIAGAAANTVTVNMTGQTTAQLETGYHVCAVANTTAVIPETSTITAKATASYFNSRYMKDVTAVAPYGRIQRNGCSVTLFNLPTLTSADDAYIRLSNISDMAGGVRATVYNEAGQKTQDSTDLMITVPAHGTSVLHTNADLGTGTYLGTKLTTYGTETIGRSRIVLTGAFPGCEAMGLVRSNGLLINMTDTTYSGDTSLFGISANGTSNTKN